MKHEQICLSEYISDSGNISAQVNRITLNGNITYQVTYNGGVLGYYDTEHEAEAVAEDSVLEIL